MHSLPKQTSNLIKVRSIALATFLLLSLLALASPNVSRVDAALNLKPEHNPKPAPLAVTATLTATITPDFVPSRGDYGRGGGPWGECGYGTQDFGPPWGNMDWNNDTYFAQGEMRGATPFVDGALASWTPIYHWCYGRGDSFSFDLSSIPINAIVQSQSASLEFINMVANSNQGNQFFLQHSGGSTFLGMNSGLQFCSGGHVMGSGGTVSNPTGYYRTPPTYICGYNAPPVETVPASLVQQWVTNRTSGSLSVYNGFNAGYSFAARTIKLYFDYVVDTTPPTTTHAVSGTSGNNGYYKSAVALALAAVDSETSIASTTLNGSTYSTPLIISTEGTTTHSYYSTDVAGNVEVTKTVSVKIDTIAPATTASLTGLMGLNNWFVRPVSVSLASTDATSGVAGSTLNGSAYTAPVTFNSEGTNTINYFATDNAGNNETTQNASFKIDTVAPTTTSSLSGTPGSNGWYTSAVTVTLTPTDATSGVGSTVLNGSAYTTPVSFSTQGTNTITYRSTDNAGNGESNQTASFKIDTVAPSASITSHTDSQWVGGVVTLSGNASDSTSGVASVEVNIDGAGWTTASGSTSWSTTWNASALADASSHTIQVRSTDAAGNVGSITSLTLQVDNAPPTAELIVDCPAMGNDSWCRDSVTVRLSGGDTGVGLQSLTYSYDGKTETLNATRASFVSGIGGITQVSLYSTDKLNKNSTTQTKEIKIDGGIPNIKFNGGDKSNLNLEVTDGESGLTRWTLQVFDVNGNSIYWKELTSEQRGDISWDGASLLGGTYFVEIFARDNAGLENHLGRTAFNVSLITLPQLFANPTPTTPAPAPRPAVAVVIQSTPIPTVTPPIAVAQLPPTNNQPPITNDQPPAISNQPQLVTIQIPPTLPPNPVTPFESETAVPILGMLLGAILAGSFILNADQRTQMAMAILVLLLTLTGGASWLLNRDDPQTLDVPLRTQDPETVFCGPTSLGMAFDFLQKQSANHQPPATSDLIQFMKSKNLLYDFGTGVEELAYAARLQGYEGSYYFSEWDITRLKQELHEGRPVLTPIKLDNYKQPVGHFVTVTGFSPDEQFVIANDPLKGEVHIPVDKFNADWQANGARGVVVAPKPVPTIPDSTLPLFAGVGAVAALAALAALGTARKGLGAGRTDEGEGTWADYSWYEPPAQVQDTWFDTQTEPAPAPQDTWFDSRVYDEGPHEQTASAPSSDEPSHGEMTPDAGVNDAPATSTQVTQATEPGWGAKDEVQQRPPEIKTIEDAKKKAQADAEAALARFMARHDDALERSDNTPTDEDYYAALKRLKEAEKREKALQQLEYDLGLHEQSSPLKNSSQSPILTESDLERIEQRAVLVETQAQKQKVRDEMNGLLQKYIDLQARYGDSRYWGKSEKALLKSIGNKAFNMAPSNPLALKDLLNDLSEVTGSKLSDVVRATIPIPSDKLDAMSAISFTESKQVSFQAVMLTVQTMLNRERSGRGSLMFDQYAMKAVVASRPDLFADLTRNVNGQEQTLVDWLDGNPNAVELLNEFTEGLQKTSPYLYQLYKESVQAGVKPWQALKQTGGLGYAVSSGSYEDFGKFQEEMNVFFAGSNINQSSDLTKAMSLYQQELTGGNIRVVGATNGGDMEFVIPAKYFDARDALELQSQLQNKLEQWAGQSDIKFTYTVNWDGSVSVVMPKGAALMAEKTQEQTALMAAGYLLQNPTMFLPDDPFTQDMVKNIQKGYQYNNVFMNHPSPDWLKASQVTIKSSAGDQTIRMDAPRDSNTTAPKDIKVTMTEYEKNLWEKSSYLRADASGRVVLGQLQEAELRRKEADYWDHIRESLISLISPEGQYGFITSAGNPNLGGK